MTLVDTSVWIDFFGARDTPSAAILESLLAQGKELGVCGVILTEVLQGIRNDKEYEETEAMLSSLTFLPMNWDTFLLASNIYRTLRSKGTTIRSSIDCMIAAVCIEHDIELLHSDKDFDRIADTFNLRLAKGRIVLH